MYVHDLGEIYFECAICIMNSKTIIHLVEGVIENFSPIIEIVVSYDLDS